MENTLIQFFTTQWPAIAILSIGWYFLVKYFMGQIDKKDALYREDMTRKDSQNQANTEKFIALVERVGDVIGKFSLSIDGIHPKLNEMHEDIKSLKK